MISALVLAAGRSSRMGSFKPLLQFGNQTVVESCVDNLRAGGVDEIVVVLGHRAGDLRARLAHWNVRFALNADPESEMGASIAAGAKEVSSDAVALFIALVDQPAIPPAVIRSLVEERQRTNAGLIIPTYEGRGGHPVLIDGCFRKELAALDPEKGMRGLFESHPAAVLRVPVDSPYVVRDLDTWDDYRVLHREVFGNEP